MGVMPIRQILLGATMLAGAGLSDGVRAQDVVGASPQVEEERGGLSDIVVTARRRTETSQDVPVAVMAIGAERLDQYDLTSLEKVSASVPQFTIGRAASGSGASLVLRGIGSNTSSIGIEQSVAVIVDGVYYGQGRVINEGFFDLERVEILKGPQALFFGKNATAGVVSLTSASPGDTPEYRARVGYEFQSEQIYGEAVLSQPLSDTLGLRLALRGSKMWGGYFKNRADAVRGANGIGYQTTDIVTGITTRHLEFPSDKNAPQLREFIGRATLRWAPTDDLTVTLKASANINDQNNAGYNYVIFRCPGGTAQRNPLIRCEPKFVNYTNRVPVSIASQSLHADPNGELGNRYHAWATTATVDYDLENVALTSVTNYNWNENRFRTDGDFVAADSGAFPAELTSYWAFSSEVRALTKFDGPINLLAGGYYQRSKRILSTPSVSGGVENSAAPPGMRFVNSLKDSQTEGETIAVFGQVTWKIIPQIEVAAGVRYTHETKDSYFVQPYAHPALVASGARLQNVTLTANQVFSNWSPEMTVTYKPSQDITIYGGYKTAYKSGGFSNSGIHSASTTVNDFAFNPETVRGFEGGIKTTLLDRQLRLNLGVYSYKFVDLQVDFFNSAVLAFTTFNAGSATTKGVEVEFEYAPRALSGFSIGGSINYNRARYENFANAPCYAGQTISMGCTIVAGRPQQDLSGTPTSMAPKWTGSLNLAYKTPISDALVVAFGLDGRYSDDYLGGFFGNPLSRQSSYINLDGQIRLATADERWEMALIGKNLTNKFYITGAQDAPLTGFGTGTAAGRLADQAGLAALPRTIQLQVTWKY